MPEQKSTLWAIDQAAAEAARASFDAHGEQWPAEDLWAWIRNAWLEDDDPRRLLLPPQMPRQFKHDYRRHYRIVSGTAAETETR